MTMTSYAQFVKDAILNRKEKLIKLSDFIWEHPEVRFEEEKSSAALKAALEEEGFSIQAPVAALDTGFVASFGTGHPIVAILGEFDALENLSQQKEVPKHAPIVDGAHGHGCGHN